jgi:hypothetical protein
MDYEVSWKSRLSAPRYLRPVMALGHDRTMALQCRTCSGGTSSWLRGIRSGWNLRLEIEFVDFDQSHNTTTTGHPNTAMARIRALFGVLAALQFATVSEAQAISTTSVGSSSTVSSSTSTLSPSKSASATSSAPVTSGKTSFSEIRGHTHSN